MSILNEILTQALGFAANFRYALITIVLFALTACQKQDQSLIVISLGGAHAKTQNLAINKPFQKLFNTAIIEGTYNNELAKIRSMVEVKQADWDIVQVETANLIRGCNEGLFEKIDWPKLGNPQEFINGGFSECGVGFFTWSIVLAYNSELFATAPQNWKDFWDVKNFPGLRGLQKTPMFALEAALLADDVAPTELYKVLATEEGVNRAFKKLDELKPYIQWWEKGSQPIPMLITNNVVMTTSFNGRASIAKNEGRHVGITWRDSFYDTDNFAIVKGSNHKELAEKYIAFSLEAPQQRAYAENSYYGFVNQATLSVIDREILKNIPNAPEYMAYSHKVDGDFWVEYGEILQQRFTVWASQ